MDNSNQQPTENSESAAENPIPQNIFLIREGVNAIPLNQRKITIGRSHENMIVVDDPRVSRRHAEIRVIRGNFVLFDLRSSGGTYINGQRTDQAILYSGDVISLAGVNFVITQDTRFIGNQDAKADEPIGSGQRETAIFRKSMNSQNK